MVNINRDGFMLLSSPESANSDRAALKYEPCSRSLRSLRRLCLTCAALYSCMAFEDIPGVPGRVLRTQIPTQIQIPKQSLAAAPPASAKASDRSLGCEMPNTSRRGPDRQSLLRRPTSSGLSNTWCRILLALECGHMATMLTLSEACSSRITRIACPSMAAILRLGLSGKSTTK